jgi:hypothetical protein
MELWRQAYMSYPTGKEGKGKRVLKPAAKLLAADHDSLYRLVDVLKQQTHNIWEHGGKNTYCGLQLFDNEADANEVVFDINNILNGK